jgi:hypothetical protein
VAQEPSAAAPRGALNLALTRVAVCLALLGSGEIGQARYWLDAARALRAPAYGLGWALPLLEQLASWLGVLQALCAAACLLGLLGWRVRWTLSLAAATASVLFALPHFSGAPRHSMHLVWFAALLAASPCALQLRCPWWNDAPRAGHAELRARLTLLAGWGLLAAIYFFPGWWKLSSSGAAWIWSDNLQHQMHWKWLQNAAIPSWRPDRHPALVQAAALGVVSFELGFPLLLGRRALRLLAACAGVLFHWAAALWLFLPFQVLVACYVALIDWEALWAWLQDRQLPDPVESKPHPVRQRLRELWLAARGVSGAQPQRQALLGSALVLGALVAGASGEMRAYPFACYPTFQWRATPDMPDLWISVEHQGAVRWLADSPALGGVRAQARWGMAWRASGAYGDSVLLQRLIGYYQTLPASLRHGVAPGDTVRFYAVRVAVLPEAWRSPPRERRLIGEWRP